MLPWEDWDGICKCGKTTADGKRCILGATHLSLQSMPWAMLSVPALAAEPSLSLKPELLPWFGQTPITKI
jgi:hypothetical protein